MKQNNNQIKIKKSKKRYGGYLRKSGYIVEALPGNYKMGLKPYPCKCPCCGEPKNAGDHCPNCGNKYLE